MNKITPKAKHENTVTIHNVVLKKIEAYIYTLPSTCASPSDAENCEKCIGLNLLHLIDNDRSYSKPKKMFFDLESIQNWLKKQQKDQLTNNPKNGQRKVTQYDFP